MLDFSSEPQHWKNFGSVFVNDKSTLHNEKDKLLTTSEIDCMTITYV